MARRAPTLYCDDGSETALPYRWAICQACNGEGKTSRHVESDGGGITASEMAELGDDFRDDYLAGVYDRACDDCDGLGRVKVADFSRMSPEDRAAFTEQERESDECGAIHAAERRMGA